MSNVTRMVDRAPVAIGPHADMGEWLKEWAAAFERGDYGKFRSVAVVLESDDGTLAAISQSLGAMDSLRLAGMLIATANRVLDGSSGVQELEVRQ